MKVRTEFMKKVSVIVPCYNAEEYLPQCLESLIRQTIGLENLDIICVDDASTDDTGRLLDAMQEQYPDSIRVFHLPENRKQGGARNAGFAHAVGEYVAFLDADDWVDVSIYEKLYEIAKQYDTDMIQYPMMKYYEGVVQVEDPAQIKGLIVLEDEEMRRLFLAGQALTCGSQTKFYKRDFLERVQVRFLEGHAYEEPSFVYPLLFFADRVYCTEKPLYYYRMHEASTMHQYVRLPGKLYDHALVQLSVLRDIKGREGLWKKYQEEIVYYFILTYFIETLHFAGSCELELGLEHFQTMQQTVQKETPEYRNNKYLNSPGFEYREFLALLDEELTQKELSDYCRKIGELQSVPQEKDSMDWSDVVRLINDGKWEQARKEIDKLKETEEQDDKAAIAEASVCEHEGNRAGVYECITAGLKYNCRNYELYVMLGNYYRERNINQAYLCYENAEFYCDEETDRQYIRQCIQELRQGGAIVTPASVVVVSYNNREMMQGCIQSIRDTTPKSAYELVVVDNASSDGVAKWLEQQDDIVLIRNKQNKGFGCGCNQGAKAAKPDNDIFFLNNDTLVPPNAIFWLRMGLYENEQTGAAGCMSNYVGNEQQIGKGIVSAENYIKYGEQNNIPDENPYERKVWLSGFALLIKRSALDEIGLFDLRYGKGFFEDDDIGVRLRYAGYHLLLCRNSFIFHYGNQSFGRNKERSTQLEESNLQIFRKKWGFNMERYTYVWTEIISLINEKREQPVRVLEVGCGAGMTLSRIKYLWPDSIVRGIESEEMPARLGKDYLGVEWGDAAVMELPYEKGFFDYIIFSYVLETFYSPEKVIRRLKPYLKENGRMLFGISNMMHVSVLASLLKGEFAYSQTDICDKSHIRFFAINDISKLMMECGLEIEDLQGVAEEYQENNLPAEIKKELYRIAGSDAELLKVCKFLVKAKKLKMYHEK